MYKQSVIPTIVFRNKYIFLNIINQLRIIKQLRQYPARRAQSEYKHWRHSKKFIRYNRYEQLKDRLVHTDDHTVINDNTLQPILFNLVKDDESLFNLLYSKYRYLFVSYSLINIVCQLEPTLSPTTSTSLYNIFNTLSKQTDPPLFNKTKVAMFLISACRSGNHLIVNHLLDVIRKENITISKYERKLVYMAALGKVGNQRVLSMLNGTVLKKEEVREYITQDPIVKSYVLKSANIELLREVKKTMMPTLELPILLYTLKLWKLDNYNLYKNNNNNKHNSPPAPSILYTTRPNNNNNNNTQNPNCFDRKLSNHNFKTIIEYLYQLFGEYGMGVEWMKEIESNVKNLFDWSRSKNDCDYYQLLFYYIMYRMPTHVEGMSQISDHIIIDLKSMIEIEMYYSTLIIDMKNNIKYWVDRIPPKEQQTLLNQILKSGTFRIIKDTLSSLCIASQMNTNNNNDNSKSPPLQIKLQSILYSTKMDYNDKIKCIDYLCDLKIWDCVTKDVKSKFFNIQLPRLLISKLRSVGFTRLIQFGDNYAVGVSPTSLITSHIIKYLTNQYTLEDVIDIILVQKSYPKLLTEQSYVGQILSSFGNLDMINALVTHGYFKLEDLSHIMSLRKLLSLCGTSELIKQVFTDTMMFSTYLPSLHKYGNLEGINQHLKDHKSLVKYHKKDPYSERLFRYEQLEVIEYLNQNFGVPSDPSSTGKDPLTQSVINAIGQNSIPSTRYLIRNVIPENRYKLVLAEFTEHLKTNMSDGGVWWNNITISTIHFIHKELGIDMYKLINSSGKKSQHYTDQLEYLLQYLKSKHVK